VMFDRRWCGNDGRRGSMGRLCLPVPPPVVSIFRGVESRTRDDGTGGFNDEYTVFGGNTQDL
jgi:hypothetical protein